ncbi:putative O-methyltransferase domain-containing protein [Seiridium cardinale]
MAPSPEILTLLDNIVALKKQYESSEAGSRDTLLELTLALLGKLEIPSEFLQRTFWAEPCKSGIIRICVEQKIFQHLSNATDGLTTEELAAKTGEPWDLRMLQRLMSHLAAMHVLALSQGRWYATPLSDGLAEQNFQSSVEFCYDSGMPSFYKFPEWFKHNGYKSPKTDIDGPFQYAWETDLPFFPWLQAHPPNLSNFAQFMSAYRAGKPSWFDPGFYPVTERIINGFDANYSDVLLCDVGGGRGHDMLGFASQYPSLPGKIVLQDQPAVVASIEVTDPPFEARAHDFFTPQPVKSRAYSLHSILHDWSDDEAVKILESLKPALKPGYSRVLLFEIVVSGEKPSFASTTMDMQMLAHLTVGERTEKDWKQLIGRAGFEVLEIYTYPGVAESVIELDLTS